jgi:glycerol kinase
MDIVNAMQKDAGITLKELKVDGGASNNNLLMQFQADILGTSVIRPQVTETTALGAAYLAGLATGYWESIEEIRSLWAIDKEFTPSSSDDEVKRLKDGWKNAVGRTLTDR